MISSPMSMPRPTSHTTLRLPFLHRRTTLPFPVVAVRHTENSAVAWLPYPNERKKNLNL